MKTENALADLQTTQINGGESATQIAILGAGIFVRKQRADSELEKGISRYDAINPAPIWAGAENYRFEPAFVEGRKLMAEIGDFINIHVIIEGSTNSSNPYYSSSWRRDFVMNNDGIKPRLSFVAGARDVAVLDAMLESGKKQGAPVQVKRF